MAKEPETQGGAVGTGTNTLEIAADENPLMRKRKEILARYAATSTAERQLDTEQTPGAADLQAGFETGRTVYEDDSMNGEIDPSAAQPEESVVDSAPSAEPTQDAPAAPSEPEMVTLTVFGQRYEALKSEVDAAGGVEVVQTRMAAEQRLRQADELAKRAQDLYQHAQDAERNLAQKQRELGSAQPSSAPTAQPNQAPAARADLAVAAAKAIEGLWSGDPEVAQKTLVDVLANVQASQGQPLDPNKIAELVVARVDRDLAVKEANRAQEQQRLAVNELMASERFAPLMADQQLKADTQTLFRAAVADPRNNGRSWVEIANEVGTRMLGHAGVETAQPPTETRAQVEVNARTNFKRRIPQPSSASERAPSAPQEPAFPTKPSDVVNMLRAARGQQVQ